MIYVISDLHGEKLSTLKKLLKKVKFSENDFLYVLGDVIDRQNDGGVEILMWLKDQTNVQFIRGNHEMMLLSCEFIFYADLEKSLDELSDTEYMCLDNYAYNGGRITIKSLMKLKEKDPIEFADIMNYVKAAPLFKKITVNNREFLLCHSGLDNFSPDRKPEEYSEDELLWARPEIDDVYYHDTVTVFGHTPTATYGERYNGKILKTDTWINIDVGVTYGNSPAILRLDDLKEFYLNEK